MRQLIIRKLRSMGMKFQSSGKNWIMTTCLNPNHTDHHASMGINTLSGAGQCFTCGFKLNPKFFTEGLSEESLEALNSKILDSKYADLLESFKEGSLINYAFLPRSDSEIESFRGLPNDFGGYICRTGSFADRVIFPLDINPDNKAKALYSGRYIGSDKDILKKMKWRHSKGFNHLMTAYPLNLPHPKNVEIKHRGTCFLVEGITDALSMRAMGYQSLCNFGVNYDVQHKEKLLLEYGIHTLVIMFDKDIAGSDAGKELMSILSKKFADIKVKFVSKFNDELIQRFLQDKNSKDFSDFYQKITQEGHS